MKRARASSSNDSFSGEGNALVTLPGRDWIRRALRRGAVDHASSAPCRPRRPTRYFDKLASAWAASSRSSSRPPRSSRRARSYRTEPRRRGHGRSRRTIRSSAAIRARCYLGCSFPAQNGYRLEDPGRRAGASAMCWLAHGVVSRFGIDFLACAEPARRRTGSITALEINLRFVGTTHPFLALQLPDRRRTWTPRPGQFVSLEPARRSTISATDNLRLGALSRHPARRPRSTSSR